jgi:hypothetical protein
MKNKSYSVVGSKKQGHRIAVPERTGVKTGDRYDFRFIESGTIDIRLPAGTLVYIPGKMRA